MAIQSSIKELGLFDLFQVLHLNAKTGRLIISDTDDGREAQILFKEGSVCLASIYERSVQTVEVLLEEWGIVDETVLATIEKDLNKCEDIVHCLERAGISSRSHLENFFRGRIRECVYNILKWDNGNCRFFEEELDAKREILVILNTENLILEGARRIDEWSNIMNKVPSRHSVFQFCSDKEQGQRLNLKPMEWEILSLIDGKRSVYEVNEAVGEDLFSTSKLIYGLVVMDVIELVSDNDESGAGLNNEERIDELILNGRKYYSHFNLEKAAAEFEKVLQLDQDNFEALRMLGEIYYKMDRLSEALVFLRKARSQKPHNQKTMFIKGYLHARLGEVDKAIAEWEELREKSHNQKIIELVKRRIGVAREWEKVLQEY